MPDVLTFFQILQNTPLPNILVLTGVTFIFLAVVGQFFGQITIRPERQKWAAIIGALFFIFGLGLYIVPDSQQPTTLSPLTSTHTYTSIVVTDSNSIVYDDFDNPAYNGKIDTSLWINYSPASCKITQSEGVMIFKNTTPGTDYECYLIVGRPSQVSFDELGVFEAKVKMATDHNGKFVNSGINIESRETVINDSVNRPGASCLLQADADGVKTEFSAANWNSDSSQDAYFTLPAEYDRWYNLRLEVDSKAQTISCFIDGNLLGSIKVESTEELENARFERNLSAYRSEGSIATSYIDDVLIMSLK